MLTVQTYQEGWTAEFFGNTAGNDTYHTLVPAFFCQHDGGGLLPLRQHMYSLVIDLRFHTLPLAVHLAQGSG